MDVSLIFRSLLALAVILGGVAPAVESGQAPRSRAAEAAGPGSPRGTRDARPAKDLPQPGKHPRLFVPDSRLPLIVSKARGPLSQVYQQHVKRDSDGRYDTRRVRFTIGNSSYLLARTLSLLLCSRIEKDPVYRDKALALARAVVEDGLGKSRREQRVRFQMLAIAYDWLHDEIASEDRKRLREGLLAHYRRERGVLEQTDEFVSGHAHFTTASLLLGAIALCDGSGEFEKDLARILDHWERFLDVARYVAADGGHHLGWHYGRTYCARLFWVSEAITTALGRDVFREEGAWLSQLGYHSAYGLRPDNTYLRVGDCHRWIYPSLDVDLVLYAIAAARYRDPWLAAFARRTLEFCAEARSCSFPAQHAFTLLFFDPSLRPEDPERLPGVRAFQRSGNYVLRTGWGPDDTVVLLRAMPWYHFNHERRDFASFTLYHRGGLAIHGGTYQAGDSASDYGGPHLTNYAWRTVAHNTITVLDPSERFCRPTGPVSRRCSGENLWSNDGGQVIRSDSHPETPVPAYQPRSVEEIRDPRFSQGDVPVFEDRPELTYILADGSRAYRPSKLKLFQRHLLFLKKAAGWKAPVVVLLDRVTSTRPSFRKTWLLHTVEEPRLEGRLAVIENSTQVVFTDDHPPKPGDYRYQYGGLLYCETLLPRDARLSFVGGAGREFWADGANHPTRIREVDRITEPGIGRIEVSPAAPEKETVFLHVLSPTHKGDSTPRPRCRTVESESGTGAIVSDHLLLFTREQGLSALSYRVDGDPRLTHVLCGLLPGREFQVTRNGGAPLSTRTSEGGLLVFRAGGGGAFEVRAAPR
jgi:heparin/heparan-sulfate lyase